MQHQSHITAINTHAEGHRGRKDRPLLLKKLRQCGLTCGWVKTCVIRSCRHGLALQSLRPMLHGSTGGA